MRQNARRRNCRFLAGLAEGSHLGVSLGRSRKSRVTSAAQTGLARAIIIGAAIPTLALHGIAPAGRRASLQKRTRAKLGIKDITMHDLRRTAGTCLSQYGVPKDVRERILNHGGKRKGSITESVYNRYEYDAEKRAALDLWADALDGIIGGRPTEIRGYSPKDASWLLIGIGGFGFCLGWILWQSNIVTFLRWTFATLLIALDAVCFRTYHLLLPFTLALIMWFASVTAGRELHVLASSTARLKPSSQTAQ